MKKIIFFIFIFMSCLFNVKAYETKYFSIDIPDDYILKESANDYNYKWENGNNYIQITISDNSSNNYNVCNFSSNDISNHKKYIENNMNKFLSDYDISYKINTIEKTTKNNNCCLKYSSYLPSYELTGYNTYQIGYIYTSDNYIITVIFSSESNIDDAKDINNTINSLKIYDKVDSNIYLKYSLLAICILICFLSIYKIFCDSHKHN